MEESELISSFCVSWLLQAIKLSIVEADRPRHVKFGQDACDVLGFALETLLTLFFHRGKLAADHRKRKTLEPKDLRLGEMLSNEEKVVESLQNCQNADLNSARSAELVSRKKRKTDIFAARSPKTPSSKGRAPASPLVDE